MSLGLGKVWTINGEQYDMWIEFEVTSFRPGTNGDYFNPPEKDEFEFEFVGVEFDPKDEPVPEDVRNAIEDWFNTSDEAFNKAYDVAADSYADYDDSDRYENEYYRRIGLLDDDAYYDRHEHECEDC